MYNYRTIFSQALRVAVTTPGLWFFGFFVALLGSSSGEIGALFSGYGFSQNDIIASFIRGLAEGGLFTVEGLRGLIAVLLTHPLYLIVAVVLLLLVLGIALLTIWLIVISQTGLIVQTVEISRNRPFSWLGGFSTGIARFWPILGLNLGIRVIEWALVLTFGVLTFLPVPWAWAYLLLAYLFIATLMIMAFIVKYATCGVALKGWRFMQSFGEGWRVFKSNWVVTIEVSLLLLAVYMFVNLVLLLVMAFIFLYSIKLFAGFVFGQIIITLATLLIFIWTETVLATFHWATWSIVFELMTSKKALLKSIIRRSWEYVRS